MKEKGDSRKQLYHAEGEIKLVGFHLMDAEEQIPQELYCNTQFNSLS